MREEDIKDFTNFLKEFQEETDRGAALVGAAIIDHRLIDTLRAFMVTNKAMSRLLDGANAPLGTFSARIDASHALGLITDHEEHELHLIRKVRNEFAHSKHGTTFNDQKIGDLCRALRSSVPGEYKDFLDQPRYMFINAVILTSLALTYRGEQIGMQRRSPLTLVAPSMRSSR